MLRNRSIAEISAAITIVIVIILRYGITDVENRLSRHIRVTTSRAHLLRINIVYE